MLLMWINSKKRPVGAYVEGRVNNTGGGSRNRGNYVRADVVLFTHGKACSGKRRGKRMEGGHSERTGHA